MDLWDVFLSVSWNAIRWGWPLILIAVVLGAVKGWRSGA